jgi:hypothetical protein
MERQASAEVGALFVMLHHNHIGIRNQGERYYDDVPWGQALVDNKVDRQSLEARLWSTGVPGGPGRPAGLGHFLHHPFSVML